jgi:hypothetical protein
MYKITFSLAMIDAELSEFELGDIDIQIDGHVITSKNKTPSQSMMIFIAISDMLDGVRAMIEQKRKEYLFVGADSSFKILFTQNKTGVSIVNEGNEYKISLPEFARELQRESNKFFNAVTSQIDTTKGAMSDLSDSLNKFNKFMQKY